MKTPRKYLNLLKKFNALENTEKSLMFSAAVENPDSKNNLLLQNIIYGRYPAIAQE
jgi:hypothetical protein